MEPRPTVVVADDHPPILQGVSRYLESHGLLVVGRAGNGEEAVRLIEAQRPALAVIDLRMPRLSGAAVVRHCARTTPECATVVFSGLADRALLTEALDAGARGFVLKDAPLEALLRALDIVAAGGMYIVRLLADGHSNESMGRELFVSPDTARAQLGVAMAKLGAATRTHAVAIALRNSLIS